MSQAIAATQDAGQAEEDFSQRLGTYAHWWPHAALPARSCARSSGSR